MLVLQWWSTELGKIGRPWHEHAKWFPLCEFVLKNKGVKFVKQVPYSNNTLV